MLNGPVNRKSKLYSGPLRTATWDDVLLDQPLVGFHLDARVVSEACKPVDRRFATEPGELALGVAPGGLLNSDASLLHRGVALQNRPQFVIPDEIERLRVLRQSGSEQRANLFQPSVCEHRIRSSVNLGIQSIALGSEANFQSAPAFKRCPASPMYFAYRLLGEKADLDRPNQLLLVSRRYLSRSF